MGKITVITENGVEEREETVEEQAHRNAMFDTIANTEKTYRIGKSTPWRRMTDSEAIAIKSAISLQSVRNQEIYSAASYIDTGDELFVTLKALLSGVLSVERAEQLLAPEEYNEG